MVAAFSLVLEDYWPFLLSIPIHISGGKLCPTLFLILRPMALISYLLSEVSMVLGMRIPIPSQYAHIYRIC